MSAQDPFETVKEIPLIEQIKLLCYMLGLCIALAIFIYINREVMLKAFGNMFGKDLFLKRRDNGK
jgi:hypothetical protein